MVKEKHPISFLFNVNSLARWASPVGDRGVRAGLILFPGFRGLVSIHHSAFVVRHFSSLISNRRSAIANLKGSIAKVLIGYFCSKGSVFLFETQ